MRIIVPYTHLSPDTVEHLDRLGIPVEYVETPADDVYAYWRLFDNLLQEGSDFLFIEGDKLPTMEQIIAMDTCHESLICGHGGFATTRFRGELWTVYGRHWLRHHQPIHWYGMDGAIAAIFHWVGVVYHRHPGMIEHHHIGPSSDEQGTGRKVGQVGHR